ncbi:MAG: hypothetical protein AAB646_00790 [Patescibacteria group bacterium]
MDFLAACGEVLKSEQWRKTLIRPKSWGKSGKALLWEDIRRVPHAPGCEGDYPPRWILWPDLEASNTWHFTNFRISPEEFLSEWEILDMEAVQAEEKLIYG